jgi:hypothetical protein
MKSVSISRLSHEAQPVALAWSPSAAPSVADEVVDEVVRELNDLHRGAALETALRMGRLIVTRFYAGDLTAWRRHTTKEASFRKLASRANSDLRISPTALYRCVALYELVERLALDTLRNLGVTHLRLVLGLPEDQQRRLLAAAEDEGWPSDRLEGEAARVRGKMPRKAGRTAMPPLIRITRTIGQLSRRARGMGSEKEDLGRFTREDLRAVHQALEVAKEDIATLQRLLLAAPHTSKERDPVF